MLKKRYEKEVEQLRAKQQHCPSRVDARVSLPFRESEPTGAVLGWVGMTDEFTRHGSANFADRNVCNWIPDPECVTESGPEDVRRCSANTVPWATLLSPSIPSGSTRQLTTSQPFVSPLLAAKNWTSRNLFGKSNPSPVATVLPQRQMPDQNVDNGNVGASRSYSDEPSESNRPAAKTLKRHGSGSLSDVRNKSTGKSLGHGCDNAQSDQSKKRHFTRSQSVTTAKDIVGQYELYSHGVNALISITP